MTKLHVLKMRLSVFFFLFLMSSGFACEFRFFLNGPGGLEQRILPGATIAVEKNAEYSLRVEFNEDHRNCPIPADDTLFMLNDEKWRVKRETQSLELQETIAWKEASRTLNTAVISFIPSTEGSSVLSISRECVKGGYHESITFFVK